MPIESRQVINAFSCSFYTKLIENSDKKLGYELVHRWTNKFDIFGLKLNFIPTVMDEHFSLVVILHARAHLVRIYHHIVANLIIYYTFAYLCRNFWINFI